MVDLIEYLEEIDENLLLAVNQLVGADWLDAIMVFSSEKWVWIPLYLILLVVIWKQVGSQPIVYLIVSVAALVIITDQGSVVFFKEIFQRYRPCHNLELQAVLKLPTGRCGGLFGFISSHASNVFGFASFVFVVMKSQSRWWVLLFGWAMLVSFSRIYLAVHYPSDVLFGLLFGSACGVMVSSIFIKTISSR